MAGRIFDGFAGGVMAKGGAKMTQRIEVANGAVKPSLSVGWAHEFTNPHTTVRESFAAIPGSGFTLTGGSTGNDLALLGAGVSYETTQRWFQNDLVGARALDPIGARGYEAPRLGFRRVSWHTRSPPPLSPACL
jgi:hypothetical protein